MTGPVTPHQRPDFAAFARALRAETDWLGMQHAQDMFSLEYSNNRSSLLLLADHVEAVGRRMNYIKG